MPEFKVGELVMLPDNTCPCRVHNPVYVKAVLEEYLGERRLESCYPPISITTVHAWRVRYVTPRKVALTETHLMEEHDVHLTGYVVYETERRFEQDMIRVG